MESKETKLKNEAAKRGYEPPQFRKYGGLAQITASGVGSTGNDNAVKGNSKTGV